MHNSGELRAARRSAAGDWSSVQTLFCPPEPADPRTAAIDSKGTASLFWRQVGSEENPGVLVSQDAPSDTDGAAACPARPPWLAITPQPARPNTKIKFDASGSRDPNARSHLWEWDFDGDGKFERSSDSDPVTYASYPSAGKYSVGLRVTYSNSRGSWSSTGYWNVEVSDDAPTQPAADEGRPAELATPPSSSAGAAKVATGRTRLRVARSIGFRTLRMRGLPVLVAAAADTDIAVRITTRGGKAVATANSHVVAERWQRLVVRLPLASVKRLRRQRTPRLHVQLRARDLVPSIATVKVR
jgi:hypothetical protein